MWNQIILFILKKLLYNKIRYTHWIAFTQYNSFLKIRNQVFNFYEKKRKKVVLKSKPYLINSEPTNHCMLQCPFCPTGKGEFRPKGFLDLDVYQKMVDQLSLYSYLITFHGWGEPLLHPHFSDMILYAHQKKICTVLTTNGMLLNKDNCQKIINSKLDVLYISLDGASSETYQKYRVHGNYDQILENLKLLVQLKKEQKSKTPFIEWQFLVFKHNEHEIEIATQLAGKIGVDHIILLPAYTEDITYDATDPKFRLSKGSPIAKREQCRHLWSTFTFHQNGIVVPCCYDFPEHIAYGNLKQDSIETIWNNPIFQESRAFINTGNPSSTLAKTCMECIAK